MVHVLTYYQNNFLDVLNKNFVLEIYIHLVTEAPECLFVSIFIP